MHIILSGWFWNQLTTGSGQYLHALVDHLPQVAPQHAYTLVRPRADLRSTNPPAAAPHQVPLPWRIHFAATPGDRLSANLAKLYFEQVSFPLACRRLQADVALIPYWGSPAWRPCRTAVTIHDLIPLLLPAYSGGLRQRLYTRLVRWTAQRAHLVLTDSQASRQDIVDHLDIPATRVRAVLLAAGAHFRRVLDPAELERVRQRYGLPDRFVLYLGGFDVRKNVPQLAQAYAQWAHQRAATKPQAALSAETPRLVIAGQLPAADTPFTPDPQRAAVAAGIADQVLFTGWVDEADKPALYSLASAFLFPSLYEGYGLPVAEAAACGAPVVTSNRSSLPEITSAAILVDPDDVLSIAAGLDQALRSDQRQPATVRRTWTQVAAETITLLTNR